MAGKKTASSSKQRFKTDPKRRLRNNVRRAAQRHQKWLASEKVVALRRADARDAANKLKAAKAELQTLRAQCDAKQQQGSKRMKDMVELQRLLAAERKEKETLKRKLTVANKTAAYWERTSENTKMSAAVDKTKFTQKLQDCLKALQEERGLRKEQDKQLQQWGWYFSKLTDQEQKRCLLLKRSPPKRLFVGLN